MKKSFNTTVLLSSLLEKYLVAQVFLVHLGTVDKHERIRKSVFSEEESRSRNLSCQKC